MNFPFLRRRRNTVATMTEDLTLFLCQQARKRDEQKLISAFFQIVNFRRLRVVRVGRELHLICR